ncbi:MAG TPA: hypothetical protein VGQ36_21635 [Thermoanaerobaculia bacterium]|jgi:hypothetical protein|nr:hypothetical protein [Thermoanaerobaculia bacterium]
MFSNRTRRLFVVVSAFLALWVASPSEGKFVTFWRLAENQANIKEGGRANTIAIHPTIPDQMFVASESGGLFRSNDRGLHWTHVDSLPLIFTQAVVFVPSNPNILLVSAKADFKTINGGGVWRSVDGGATWAQATLNVPSFGGRLSGFELSIMPGTGLIAAGTSEGVFLSSDNGATWSYSDVFGGGNRTVFAVLATPGRIYAGGPQGVRIANAAPFTTWTSPVIDPATNGGVHDIHAFGRSPLSPSHAFVVNGATELFRTENGGQIWTLIPAAPAGGGSCGGISFAKAVSRNFGPIRFLEVYAGNRCHLHRLLAPVNGTTADFSGTWQQADLDHMDTRDLAFIGNEPVLLATDGGLHNTADRGSTWRFVGGGRDGYNALQITEVKGQLITKTLTTDLYFGTQDNNLWAINVWGNVWDSHGAEGFFIEAERRVPTQAESKITYTACGGCRNWVSGRHFAGAMPWPNPPGSAGQPVLIRRSHYVHGVGDSGSLDPGLALTEDSGSSWQEFAEFTEERRDLPKLGRSGDGDPEQTTIVYQAFRAPNSDNRLMRIHKRPGEDGVVFFPAMTNFGGLGINPTMFAWYQVYAIDPGNAFHIIAPDVVNQRMMETRDGGGTWTEIPGLTELVTDNGNRLFRTDLIGFGWGQVFPVATAVSFSPQDPRLVLIGTSEGGIFASNDNGATWKKIQGSDPATYITSFFWKDANTVFVSTYGRGLWRLMNTRVAFPDAFDDLCGGCDVISNDGGSEPPPFDGGALVFEGSVLGVRTENGQLREMFVTAGSSVVFTGDQKDPQDDIAITEGAGREMEQLPKPPDGWLVKGVVFTSGDKLTGAVVGESETSLVPPVSRENYEGPTESPTKGKPYIRLTSSDFNGVPAVLPAEVFDLSATGFVAGATYELLVDGAAIKGTITADGGGSFAARITAPSTHGYHRMEVRLAGEEQVIDGSVFLVRHLDED